MAIDGSPPTHLPPGAKWCALSQSDLPFAVPAGSRYVITSALLSFVEPVGVGGTRELFPVAPVEQDGNPNVALNRVFAGIAVPPVLNASVGLAVSNLALPVAAGGVVTGATFPAGQNQIEIIHGYLEPR